MKTAIVLCGIFFAATAMAQNDQQAQVYVDAQYSDPNYQQQGYGQQGYNQQGYAEVDGQVYYDEGGQQPETGYGAAQGAGIGSLQIAMQNYFAQMEQKMNALKQQQDKILENQEKTFAELEVLKMRIRRA